jgi:hypothetical protein
MQPRQMRETSRPVLPSFTYSIDILRPFEYPAQELLRRRGGNGVDASPKIDQRSKPPPINASVREELRSIAQ